MVVKFEDLCGLGLISTVRRLDRRCPETEFSQRKFWIACHQGTREYAQVPRAGDLKYRFQIGDGPPPPKNPPGRLGPHVEASRARSKIAVLPNKIEHGVDASRMKLAYFGTQAAVSSSTRFAPSPQAHERAGAYASWRSRVPRRRSEIDCRLTEVPSSPLGPVAFGRTPIQGLQRGNSKRSA